MIVSSPYRFSSTCMRVNLQYTLTGRESQGTKLYNYMSETSAATNHRNFSQLFTTKTTYVVTGISFLSSVYMLPWIFNVAIGHIYTMKSCVQSKVPKHTCRVSLGGTGLGILPHECLYAVCRQQVELRGLRSHLISFPGEACPQTPLDI